jgi:hypothetical protein
MHNAHMHAVSLTPHAPVYEILTFIPIYEKIKYRMKTKTILYCVYLKNSIIEITISMVSF